MFIPEFDFCKLVFLPFASTFLELIHLRLQFLVVFSHIIAFICDTGATLSIVLIILIRFIWITLIITMLGSIPILGGHHASLPPSKPPPRSKYSSYRPEKASLSCLPPYLPSVILKVRFERQKGVLSFLPSVEFFGTSVGARIHYKRVHLRYVCLHWISPASIIVPDMWSLFGLKCL